MPYVPSVVRWPRGNYGRSDVFAGQGALEHAPKSNAPTASQRNVEGADASAATRGVRDWRQDEEDKGQNTIAPSRRKRRSSGRKESPASVPGLGIPRLHARMAAVASTFFAKAAVLLPQLCFIAAVARFRTVLLWFVQRSGTQGDTVRTQHVETTARLASKTAARRIKADIRGSALPITRNEETQ